MVATFLATDPAELKSRRQDLVERVAPLLARHCERVQGHPKVMAYQERRRAS